jgi:hypothetical protein
MTRVLHIQYVQLTLQVVTSVTYKTHPNPSHIQVAQVQFNVTDNSTYRVVVQKSLAAIPGITEAGYTGSGSLAGGFNGIFVQPNATNETFASTFAPLYEISKLPNVSGQVMKLDFPTWIDYCNVLLQDLNIATNSISSSRLLTADVMLNHNKELVELIVDYPDLMPGLTFGAFSTPNLQGNSNCFLPSGYFY